MPRKLSEEKSDALSLHHLHGHLSMDAPESPAARDARHHHQMAHARLEGLPALDQTQADAPFQNGLAKICQGHHQSSVAQVDLAPENLHDSYPDRQSSAP